MIHEFQRFNKLHILQYKAANQVALHVSGVIVSSRGVAAAQDIRNLDGGAERRGERRSVVVRGTGARVVVDGECDAAGVGLGGGPLGPASRVDNVANGRLLEDDVGVLAPGAPEVVGARGDGRARVGGNVAVIEDVLALAGGRSTVGYEFCVVSLCTKYSCFGIGKT